jgi:hypothetical protein
MEEWRFSLQSESKTERKNRSQNNTRRWSGVRATFTGRKCWSIYLSKYVVRFQTRNSEEHLRQQELVRNAALS